MVIDVIKYFKNQKKKKFSAEPVRSLWRAKNFQLSVEICECKSIRIEKINHVYE